MIAPRQSRFSKGCEACRTRKKKCDGNRPSCHNCLSKNKVCPGYRNLDDLIFRNENHITKQRAHKSHKDAGLAVASTNFPASTPYQTINTTTTAAQTIGSYDNTALVATASCAVYPRLSTNTTDLGVGFYMTCYTVSKPEQGFLYFVPSFLKRISAVSPVAQLVKAIGLANFANVRRSQKLLTDAKWIHNGALNTLNGALSDPSEALTDETLTAVMLLSQYEGVCGAGGSEGPLSKHVDGATTLVHFRGEAQFQSRLGRHIFTHVVGLQIFRWIIVGVPIPDDMEEGLQLCLIKSLPSEYPTLALNHLFLRICRLHTAFTDDTTTSDISEVLATATGIINELEQWSAQLMPLIGPQKVYSTGPPNPPFLDWHYDYEDSMYFGAWNMYRLARLLTTYIALSCIHEIQQEAGLDYSLDLLIQYNEYKASLTEIALQICSSVRYLMGMKSERDDAESWSSNAPFAPLMGPMAIVPLFYVAVGFFTPPEVKEWAVAQLLVISSHLGLRYGTVVYEKASRGELSDRLLLSPRRFAFADS